MLFMYVAKLTTVSKFTSPVQRVIYREHKAHKLSFQVLYLGSWLV